MPFRMIILLLRGGSWRRRVPKKIFLGGAVRSVWCLIIGKSAFCVQV